jgi:drug/metabolite transporter (DMT)-like permease
LMYVQVHLREFMIMGIFDALANTLAFFGSVGTSGTIQNLLNQSLILFSMLFAFIYLKQRYVKYQYYGVLLVMIGIVIALLPTLINGGSAGNIPVFNLLFMLSSPCAACSLVYKEKALKIDMDAIYLQFCTVIWTFVFGWALAPLNTLSILGNAAISFEQIPESLKGGFKCLVGINTIISNCSNDIMNDGAIRSCDNCQGSWIILLLFILFNTTSVISYVCLSFN